MNCFYCGTASPLHKEEFEGYLVLVCNECTLEQSILDWLKP